MDQKSADSTRKAPMFWTSTATRLAYALRSTVTDMDTANSPNAINDATPIWRFEEFEP
jgi:hypothetical protein